MASLNSVPIMGESYDITSLLLFMMNLQVRHVKMETRKRINTNHQVDHPKFGLKLKGQRTGLKPLKEKDLILTWLIFSPSPLVSSCLWLLGSGGGGGGVLFKKTADGMEVQYFLHPLLTSTSAMKASKGSSSLSEPPPAFICCRVGEFSAGM